MALDKSALATALKTAFQAGMDDPNWTLAQAAGAMADAIDAHVRNGELSGIKSDVTDTGGNPIGHAVQTAAVKVT
ncbi:hypothetical protein [Sphingomonas sp.]|jgi:hypothetical protein|uniref:hypothetical protein n=1 Tax=Sphingomonas sp. TaxID=28214 RepID=UPI002E32881D|nr:hypothetical protein [Sphingomonas sp.]HEX4694633.1 hypothetical protein [Sphingomonas sp.]